MKTQAAILGVMACGTIAVASMFGGCGTDPGDTFDSSDGTNTSGGASGGASGGQSSGNCIGCGTSNGGASGGGTSNGGTSGNPLEECAQQTLGGNLKPIELTLVFDKSASMCYQGNSAPNFDCTNQQTRWPATSAALRNFFTDPKSAGLTVAVRSFGPIKHTEQQREQSLSAERLSNDRAWLRPPRLAFDAARRFRLVRAGRTSAAMPRMAI